MSTTIRVTDETRQRIASIAESTGRPMTEVVADAVDALERRVFFDELDARYQELRSNRATWAEIEAERASEEGALRDASE